MERCVSCGVYFVGELSKSHHYCKPEVAGTVGARLLEIIPSVFKDKSCQCDLYASELDRRGNEWCREHRNEIVDNIYERASKRFGSVLPLAKTVIGHWVDKAIANAESSR